MQITLNVAVLPTTLAVTPADFKPHESYSGKLIVSFCRVFGLIKRGISDDDGPHTTQYII